MHARVSISGYARVGLDHVLACCACFGMPVRLLAWSSAFVVVVGAVVDLVRPLECSMTANDWGEARRLWLVRVSSV